VKTTVGLQSIDQVRKQPVPFRTPEGHIPPFMPSPYFNTETVKRKPKHPYTATLPYVDKTQGHDAGMQNPFQQKVEERSLQAFVCDSNTQGNQKVIDTEDPHR
jgi:hypothetical protein